MTGNVTASQQEDQPIIDAAIRQPDNGQVRKDCFKVHWLPMWDYLDLRLVRFFFTVGNLQIFANTSG
ncbi:hypothetical protein EF767_10895 [Escherichia coli]|nr:hypothetical protein [Escherichia coli]RLZ30556.1 hypothetical protein EA139_21715 [Escherichia coli]HAJ2498694.1 hypothetical protein [Escherichia coli]